MVSNNVSGSSLQQCKPTTNVYNTLDFSSRTTTNSIFVFFKIHFYQYSNTFESEMVHQAGCEISVP